MAKIKTSMKITNNFKNVFRCGYCDLQKIMQHNEPYYYNCGVYGWNCDLFVDYATDTIISTGYRNMRGERIPNKLLEKYNKKADEIDEKFKHDFSKGCYDRRKKSFEKLQAKFFEELTRI